MKKRLFAILLSACMLAALLPCAAAAAVPAEPGLVWRAAEWNVDGKLEAEPVNRQTLELKLHWGCVEQIGFFDGSSFTSLSFDQLEVEDGALLELYDMDDESAAVGDHFVGMDVLSAGSTALLYTAGGTTYRLPVEIDLPGGFYSAQTRDMEHFLDGGADYRRLPETNGARYVWAMTKTGLTAAEAAEYSAVRYDGDTVIGTLPMTAVLRPGTTDRYDLRVTPEDPGEEGYYLSVERTPDEILAGDGIYRSELTLEAYKVFAPSDEYFVDEKVSFAFWGGDVGMVSYVRPVAFTDAGVVTLSGLVSSDPAAVSATLADAESGVWRLELLADAYAQLTAVYDGVEYAMDVNFIWDENYQQPANGLQIQQAVPPHTNYMRFDGYSIYVHVGDTELWQFTDSDGNPVASGLDFDAQALSLTPFANPDLEGVYELTASEEGSFPISLDGMAGPVNAEAYYARYLVSFDYADGTDRMTYALPKENTTVARPADPSRAGYVFVEWQLEGQAYDFAAPVTDNLVLTAVWEEAPYVPPAPAAEEETTAETDAEGNVEATVAAADAADGAVTLPTEVKAAESSEEAPTVAIDMPEGAGTVTVEIPVENVSPADVAVLVHADGTEEILPDTAMTGSGLAIKADGDVTVKVVHVENGFEDVPETGEAADAIRFVTARGLYDGVSETEFKPDAEMNRAMVATVLYRLNRRPDAGEAGTGFDDVEDGQWYTEAIEWAAAAGIVEGKSEDSYGVTDPITREQLVLMLWRMSGKPAAAAVETGASDWAAEAMSWAVSVGLIEGNGVSYAPKETATRAETAIVLMRYINL